MKMMIRFKTVLVVLASLAVGMSAKAQGITNNFNNSLDYLANGVLGSTWDGVYYGFGDVPNGNNNGDGNGFTTEANETLYPGFLTVDTTSSSWPAPGNDGFLLYKVVSGDFDASIGVAGQYANTVAYNFAGLMARAANKDGSAIGGLENSVSGARFQQYGTADKVFYATNGNESEFNFNGADTNTAVGYDRYYRITRVGNVFTVYYATNSSKVWGMLRSFTNNSLTGVSMQVGPMQTLFTANSAEVYFIDFELIAANVTSPVLPPAPSALVTTATNTGGSLTFSWTRGYAGDSSLVVMRVASTNGNIQYFPVQGVTYTANSTYGDTNTWLDGAREYVVYNGTGNSVTVTNLAGNNTIYNVAVYEYTNDAPIYNTANPVTGDFPGPGVIMGVSASFGSTNVPVGGATVANLYATFSTGQTVDETASPDTVWTTGDSTIVQVGADGTVNGITNGTTWVVGTFAGTFYASNNITVVTPAFKDGFGVTQDYVANGLQGSTWDGLFLNYGDVPGANKGNDNSPGQTFLLIANTNVLSLQAAGGSWRVAGNDGTYLFKIVRGDFQASVHVTCSTINNNYAGIMARLFGTGGAGGGSGGTESHVNWGNPQQNIPSARLTIDSGGTTVIAGLNNTDRWLLMQRVNSTNFYFYEKSSATALWSAVPTATMVLTEAAGNAPMEVGLFEEMRAATTGTAQYDTLMIDGPGIVSPNGTPPPPPATNLTVTLNPDLTMTFSWVSTNSDGSPAASILVMRAGGPVTAQPTYGLAPGYGGAFGAGLDLSDGNYVVARSSSSPTTVTVTGLTPGVTYYAAVFTFAGAYPDRVYNNLLPATGATVSQPDGLLESVQVLPVPSIPLGGLQVGQVIGYFGGQPVNVSAFATITVANTNVVQFADGAFTGMGLGSTTAQIVYGGLTNTVGLTVRPPGFADEFGVPQDYLANGVTNSQWAGVYRQPVTANEVPLSEFVPVAGEGTVVADANISSNNVLTITASGSGWEENNVGGFFLFKYVPADFQMAVHINSYDINGYNMPGLLARAYGFGTNGATLGAPFVIGTLRTNASDQTGAVIVNTYGESWVSLTRFDEFGIGTYVRLNLDSAVHQSTQPDILDTNYWLLVSRSNGTNFNFYMRLSAAGPWRLLPNKTALHILEFAGAPMQAGLMAGPWTGGGDNRTVMYEHFMLDAAPLLLQVSRSGGDVDLSWPAVPGVVLQQTLSLSPVNWQPVPGTLVTNAGLVTISVPMTNAATFFRLSIP